MPFPILPKPQFPNVPNLFGVPALVRSILFPPTPPPSFSEIQGRAWKPSRSAPRWGVFNAQLQQVVEPDSIIDFDYRNDSRVSNYPTQDGAFSSFNKVANPYDAVVRMAKGGQLSDRTEFLAALDRAQASLELYTILTPEKTYRNANVTRYELIRRGPSGSNFLLVDVHFEQIRQGAALYTTTVVTTANAQNPAAVPPANQGKVQAQTPAESTLSKLSGALKNFLGVK